MGRARRQAAQRAFDRERDDRAARRAADDARSTPEARAREGKGRRVGATNSSAIVVALGVVAALAWRKARARAAKTDGDDARDRSARGAAATKDGARKRLSFSGSSVASAADAAATTDATIERDEGERGENARVETVENEKARPAARAVEEKAVDSGEVPRPATPPRATERSTRSTPGSPASRPALKLEVETGASRGATYVASLGMDEFTIGRGRMNGFVVESSEVSTVHAKVRWNGVAWTMRDLGSLNGTRVNGMTISESVRTPGGWRKITHGDVIKLGERDSSPRVSVHFFRDVSIEANAALALQAVVRAEGSKPMKSEDRILVECPLRGNPSVGLFCVFDGHGGQEAAERARQLFPEVLARRLGGKVPGGEGARELLEAAFIESDETMAVEYEGCTASVVLVWKNEKTGGLMVQAANVGDSSVALGRVPVPKGQHHGARYLTPEHKVRHEEEKNRLNEAGADLPPEATRLYGLALSRALGDKFLKDQKVGLIAHPFVSEVLHIEGNSNDSVLTIASDGIWDVLTPKDVYDTMHEADGCLHTSCQSLILNARRRRSVDDISIVTVRLSLEST